MRPFLFPESFDSLRSGCGGGWVVFEIPGASQAQRVTFGFDDTGSYRHERNQVSARFSWRVPS
jgi:hypothetical protein